MPNVARAEGPAVQAEPADWYREVPHLYDLIFDQGTASESAFVAACMAAYGRPAGRRLLEPACGTGRLMAALTKMGFVVDGFDLSAEMLAIASERLKGSGSVLWQDRLEAFHSAERYDGAYNLVSTFKYLLDEEASLRHLEHVAQVLRPGGIYVLGFHLTDYEDTMRSRERWHAVSGRLQVTCNIQSWPANRATRLERVRSRLRAVRNNKVQTHETLWDFRTYDAAEVRHLLSQVPALEHIATFDFCHDIDRPRALHDEQLDVVLVLRRSGRAR